MNLFLTSTIDCVREIESLKQLINGRTKLIVLPFAHDFEWLASAEDIYEKYDRCPKAKNSIFHRTVKPFIDIGIDMRNIVVINHFADPIALIKQKLLADNTIVYLPGGRPENIMKILRRLNLIDTIKQCKIVVGESAGAMIWSKYFFVYPDADYPRYQKFKGLSLTKDCVIIPHFKISGYNKHVLRCCRRFSWFHKDTIRLIEDGGWIHYDTIKNKINERNRAIRY